MRARYFAMAAVFVLACTIFAGSSSSAVRLKQGQFIIRCNQSHIRAADPIVAPGTYPSAHEHLFFGNNSADENSTFDSMEASTSSCKDSKDTAGYWLPTLYNGTSLVNVIFGFFYYQGNANTHPFPLGLKMVAGGLQDPTRTFWDCFRSGHKQATPPSCTGGTDDYLVLRLRFPDCWNGVDLDSADHRSHMTYSSPGAQGVGTCPAGWIQVPSISLFNRYPAGIDPTNLHLSDMTVTAHADFWNTWQPGEQEALVQRCLDAGIDCGQISG
jgi:uncharacterized protein DUF1996